MSKPGDEREARKLVLLAAAVATLLREQRPAVGDGEPLAAAWVRCGHRGLGGAWAWNPRAGASWRLAARLENQRR